MSARFTRPDQGRVLTRSLTIGQFGVTFNFALPVWAGIYANGDWWVKPVTPGPVTITAISPASQLFDGKNWNNTSYAGRTVHGAQVNPGNRAFATGGLLANNATNTVQGWDTLTATSTQNAVYSAAANVDPGKTGVPLVLTSGSVLKFVSRLTGLPNGNRPVGADMVVLTVVDAFPAPDAIRPGVSTAGNKASRIRLSDVNLGVFRNLAPTANAPTFAQALAWVNRFIETSLPDSVNNGNAKGTNNHREYGREIANDLHRALLCLHLSSFTSAQKLRLCASFLTLAEDLISRAEEGAFTSPDGGGNQWKLAPIVVMAAALGDKIPAAWTTYLSAAQRTVWGENTQMLRVTPYDVAFPRFVADGRPRVPFNMQMVGSAEWAVRGSFGTLNNSTAGGISQWAGFTGNLLYRDNVANSSVLPGMLAVELTTGGRALWNFEERWLYYATCFANRNEAGSGNQLLAFSHEMLEAYRTPIAAAPTVIEASVRDADLFLRCSLSLFDITGVTPPPTSAFTVLVNGSPRTVTATQVWRQNVGLTLASPVTGTDVVTISHTEPASNPVRSVDGVSLASFSGLAVTNRSEKVGGTNTAFPVVRFTPGVQRHSVTPVTLASANGALGTIAIIGFQIDAAPVENVNLFRSIAGLPGFNVTLQTDRRLLLNFRNAAGAAIANIRTAVLPLGTRLFILLSMDFSQSTGAAGMNCFINGSSSALAYDLWAAGPGVQVGWARDPASPFAWNQSNNGTFELGAFYLNTEARVDITSPAERAKFEPGSIGSRGDGVTGSIPAQFHVGNAAQWNDLFGMNRGVGAARFFPNTGMVSLGSLIGVGNQQEWGVTPPPAVANLSASVSRDSAGQAIVLAPSGPPAGPFTSLAIATPPSNGSVILSGTTATYTPNPGFSGADSFTYTATGPGGTSAPATVSIIVVPPLPRFDNTALTFDNTAFTWDRSI